MASILRNNRLRINKELDTIEKRRDLSPAILSLCEALLPQIEDYAAGNFIDIGCGQAPYRTVIESRVTNYVTADIEQRTSQLDFICDIQDMQPIDDGLFDSAGCFDVLEHVPDTEAACREMGRILKSGGYLIVTTPFLARLHEQPHDYFRFSEYGLEHVFEKQGFVSVRIQPYGGLFSFLGHQVSTLLVCSTWHIPVLRSVVFQLNRWIITRSCYFLDKAFRTHKVAPCGYVSVFEKA